MKNIRALVKECAMRVLKEDLSSTDHDRISGEIYAKLQEHGFQTKGDEPNQYSEYYLWNFATIQCGVRPDHVYVERYYDSERMDDMHRKTQKIPLPDHYDQNYVNTVVALCVKWQRSIKGDESIFGGMDDVTEVNHTQDERGKSVIAVGAPGSIARMKVEYPDTIAAMVAALTKRFGPPSPDLHDVIQDAALAAAGKILDKTHGIGVKSLAQAAAEAYWEQNKQVAENTGEDPKDAYYVEYVGERVGEEPFTLGNSERKFQYVNGKYPDGTIDIAVYSFAGDLCYGYKAFRSMMGIEEGFDPTSVGPNPAASEGETVYDPYTSMNAKMRQMESSRVCGQCNGSGEGRHEGSKCTACHGSGEAGYKKPLTKRTDPDYDWDGEDEERRLTRNEMVGPVDPSVVEVEAQFQADIENLKKTHPHLSFGYIGNYESDPRIGDNRSWYVWNVKNGTRQKWGGFDTKDLPQMWKQWQTAKEKILGVSENMGRYAQEAGALDLKEALELTPTGADDEWSRPVYTDQNGKTYVDINCGSGQPSIHSVTDSGEPDFPVRNFKIVGSAPERFPDAICPRCKNSKPEYMDKSATGMTKCKCCHWQDNPGEPYKAGMNPSENQVSENATDNKTFQQIRDEQDPKGKNHDLTLTCVKCGTTETCRCSKPKRKFKGICAKCC
jgi:hypothetical protein